MAVVVGRSREFALLFIFNFNHFRLEVNGIRNFSQKKSGEMSGENRNWPSRPTIEATLNLNGGLDSISQFGLNPRKQQNPSYAGQVCEINLSRFKIKRCCHPVAEIAISQTIHCL